MDGDEGAQALDIHVEALALDHEGRQVAAFFNAMGISAFVLKYRLNQTPADMPAFIRKGVVGDWRNCFSTAQARRLAEKCARHEAIEALWPGLVANALE